jgi:hypothetical protein
MAQGRSVLASDTFFWRIRGSIDQILANSKLQFMSKFLKPLQIWTCMNSHLESSIAHVLSVLLLAKYIVSFLSLLFSHSRMYIAG